MRMKVQTPQQYEASLRKLFPRGEYWDRQFADPHSDCSLFCKAKTAELVQLRKRMSGLHDESMITTAVETLDNWERVCTGSVTIGLDAEERRTLLMAETRGRINLTVIKEIARVYGMEISNIEFPFRPAFFGFSRCGHNRIASLAAFSTVTIHAAIGQKKAYALFEKHYRRSCFGFSRCGLDRHMHPGIPTALHTYIELENDDSMFDRFKANISTWLQANHIIYFSFGGQ
ncbi:MAG: YmfQ family protein [Treponema sp.]|nr:YmfQ family protein [Treponema sp.]